MNPQDNADIHLAHDHLHLAAELINGVLERNRIGTPLQMLSFLAGAKADADLSDKELGMAEKYAGWTNNEPAAS